MKSPALKPLAAAGAAQVLWILAALLTLPYPADAKPWWLRGVESNDADFLDPDRAFKAVCRVDGDVLKISWIIADGYYLYRQRMAIEAESPDLELATPTFPRGVQKTDPYLGTQEIFVQQVEATVPYFRHDGGAHPIQVKVTYQGCAEAGLCYPPISKVLIARAAPQIGRAPSRRWEGAAILGGAGAFLFAGFVLRKGRRLDTPTA